MKSLITCLVAGAGYLIHPQKLGSIQETINPDSVIPVTLLTTEEIFGDLEAQLRFFDVVDDVFVPEFGAVLVEKPGGNESTLPLKAGSLGVRELYHLGSVRALDDVAELPSGPYFLHGPNLYQAWKLYDDTAGAFTVGVLPEDVNKPDKFLASRTLSTDGVVKSVPVPSRLYHPPPHPELPLSGIRLSVTESLSLNGMYTTLSSRAWSSLQISPAHSTDSFVKSLLEMGAVVVGKTKTSQFDVGDNWIDDPAPWSPRADGYQAPGGTSAGASAALASYDWLQYAVAKDSIHSTQHSRALQGLFSLRPSISAVARNSDSGSVYKSIGFSARDILDLFDLADATLDLAKHEDFLPQNLIYPLDFFANSSEIELALQKQFITTLENFLGVKSQPLSLAELWLQKPPVEAAGQGMQEYLDEAPFMVFCYDLYHQYDKFREDYREAFDHQPYTEATVQFHWDIGKNVSQAQYKEYKERLDIFENWFDQNVMALQKSPDTVLLLPPVVSSPTYRDDLQRPAQIIKGITPEFLSPMLQTPHLIAPFAQTPHESRISGQTDYLPVSASLMGPRGSDLVLIQAIRRAFELAAWRTRVDTGRLAFPIGDNPRNVDDQHRPDAPASPSSRMHHSTKEAPAMPVLNEL